MPHAFHVWGMQPGGTLRFGHFLLRLCGGHPWWLGNWLLMSVLRAPLLPGLGDSLAFCLPHPDPTGLGAPWPLILACSFSHPGAQHSPRCLLSE